MSSLFFWIRSFPAVFFANYSDIIIKQFVIIDQLTNYDAAAKET